jgi:hypothetical protein
MSYGEGSRFATSLVGCRGVVDPSDGRGLIDDPSILDDERDPTDRLEVDHGVSNEEHEIRALARLDRPDDIGQADRPRGAAGTIPAILPSVTTTAGPSTTVAPRPSQIRARDEDLLRDRRHDHPFSGSKVAVRQMSRSTTTRSPPLRDPDPPGVTVVRA